MQSDSNRTSLNLSNNFPSLYLRIANFPKNCRFVLSPLDSIYRELTVRKIS